MWSGVLLVALWSISGLLTTYGQLIRSGISDPDFEMRSLEQYKYIYGVLGRTVVLGPDGGLGGVYMGEWLRCGTIY